MIKKSPVLAALAFLWPAIASANIVADPGFELNNGSWSTVDFAIITTPSSNDVPSYANSGLNSMATGCPNHGCVATIDQDAYFQQTLATTAGQTYELSFFVGESEGPPSEFSVFWNGNPIPIADVVNPANATFPGPFVMFDYSGLLATGDSTVLQIHGVQDPGHIYFDDISVSAVPEPSTWAMMLLGFAGHWLHGLSPEVKANIDGRLIHDHQA